ncbi:MAG: hypothetical protein JWM37_215 [Candidatus Saccharibacteria bacterium]|nr:hypothetical protein [Candidatus Saccharibacteria bacterium]
MMSVLQQLAVTTATNCPGGGDCTVGLPAVTADQGALQTILQVTFGTIAAIAVISIIVSVIRLLLTTGDPAGASKFREALIYSVVGLIIALSAEVIVTYVLNNA